MRAQAKAILIVTLKRILAQPGLALATLVGLVIVVALTMSIPLYADAIYYRTFMQNVIDEAGVARPPFALMFYYGGGRDEPVEWEDAQQADAYITRTAGAELGLPQQVLVRHFRTDYYSLFPVDETVFKTRTALTGIRFGFISDLEAHITLLEGQFPANNEDDAIGVLVSEALAAQIGLQIGEEYLVYARNAGTTALQIPVRIVGVWRAADRLDSYWFVEPESLDNQLIVSEGVFVNRISPQLNGEIYAAIWYLVLDGTNVNYSLAAPLVNRINKVEQEINARLPNTRLAVSPRDALNEYRRAADVLTILLYAFGIPVIGLLVAFIGLTARLMVEQRRNEIAMLRSRGAMAAQMVGMAGVEALLFGLLALAAGSAASVLIARLIGQARSFLDFTADSALRLSLTVTAITFGAAIVGLALAAQVLPTSSAARHTVVSYKQTRARTSSRPWWQRFWVDLLLLIPAIYGAYLLRQQGAITTGEDASSLFDNPLLFLIPVLGILALTLLFLRLMPVIMGGVAWLAAQTRSVAFLMSVRYLVRSPELYTTPLMLLIFTLSLSAFTASLAQTLDSQLYDRVYYQTGADVRFFDFGQDNEVIAAMSGTVNTGPRWEFQPISEYLKVPGVHTAARAGRYSANTRLGGRVQNGWFLGVDRLEFSQVAFWRPDFADESLGGLMNGLARRSDSVLLPRDYMDTHGLRVGDVIRIDVLTYDQRATLDLEIAGMFDRFPTWNPEEGPIFVGNLDYLFGQLGRQFPYYVWLRADPTVTPRDLGVSSTRWQAAQPAIWTEQQRPERQGLFGILSVGFGASALLTVVGFLLYALFSFRRRFIEMGVLRAIGLSARQMAAFLAWELGLLIVMGGITGTLLGAVVSAAFIPYLQVTPNAAVFPPTLVEIAWPSIARIYALFSGLFAAALATLLALLRRMRIFQAIKLGETI